MKKVLILFAGLSLLASCAQNIEPVDKEKEKPKESTTEFTIQTKANLTRAIAGGETMPTDNFIRLMPYFRSDIKTVDYDDYNSIRPFGYDFDKKVWRGIALADGKTKGILDELQKGVFTFNPLYWPGGDRVRMDYVACSYFNILDVLLGSAHYFGDRYDIREMIAKFQEEHQDIIDFLMAVYPKQVNLNRMDVEYQNLVLNLASAAMILSFEEPVIHPYSVAVVLALSIITDTPTGLGIDCPIEISFSDILVLADIAVEMIMGGGDKPEIPEKFKELFAKNGQPVMDFCNNYVAAYNKLTDGDVKGLEDLTKAHSEGRGKKLDGILNADETKAINDGYWLFMHNLPIVGRYIQDDIMYAYDRNLQNNTQGTIQAKFNHAKAWVKVVVNNMTGKDLFVSGIRFEDVKLGGKLVIDNSKSAFEAYWDFSNYHPAIPFIPEEEDTEYGLEFEPYNPVNIDIVSGANVAAAGFKAGTKATKSKEQKKSVSPEIEKMLLSTGIIPDTYLVPAGCYGPALAIEKSTYQPDVQEIHSGSGSAVVEEHAVPVGEDPAATSPCVSLSFLRGDYPFRTEVADNLSGAMFPSQEPGMISLAYYCWDDTPNVGKDTPASGISRWKYDMAEASKYLYGQVRAKDVQQVTLNLPRQYWDMGKVYIYVINIGNNEITINPYVTEWKDYEENPIVGPEETAPHSGDPTETLGEGDTEGWF